MNEISPEHHYRQVADILWSQALEGSELAHIIIDPYKNSILQFTGKSIERLTGMTAREFAQLSASDLFPGKLAELIVLTEGAMILGQAWDNRLEIRTNHGSLPVELSASSFRFGEMTYVLLSFADKGVVEYRHVKSAQAGGRQLHLDTVGLPSETFLKFETANKLILEAAGEGIYGVDAAGLTTFVNPAAGRMLGWQPEELIGQVAHFMIHHSHECGDHYPISDCPIYAAFQDGAVHHVDNEVFWRKDGSSFPVEYTSTPIRHNGKWVGAVIVFRDVSERREAERKLKSVLTEVEALQHRLEQENAYLQSELLEQHNHRNIVGESRPIKMISQQIDLVGPTDATVLITGESGTGKELIARAIHESSARARRPLIRVNCAAIPKELFESEFFGHAKGAFTGATSDRVGRFELADGATIFLDEIGELPLDQQAKLLRVLQEQQFERVGEAETRKVDVRVIAATNQNLRRAVDKKKFREDLYFRLNVFPIEAPPLRSRAEDIPVLAIYFAEKASERLNKATPRLTKAEAERLKRYEWPGNIRELENAVERAVIVSKAGKLTFDLPGLSPQSINSSVVETDFDGVITDAMRREREKSDIIDVLRISKGRVSGKGGAAELLGVKPTTLYSRLKRLNINTRIYQGKQYR